jgi:hypothetical protein
LLYIWFVIGHGRREILHFGVTAHPTSPWVVQQLRDAFPEESAPRFLIYDNDSIFSERVTESIENIGIEPQRTAFRSPMAEWDCREMGRQRSPRVAGSRGRHERTAPASPAARLCRLLQRRSSPHSASGFTHGATHRVPAFTGGPNRWTAPSRRPTSSLQVAGSSMTIGAAYPIRRIRGRRTNFENPQVPKRGL